MKKYAYLLGILSVGIQPLSVFQGPISAYPLPSYGTNPTSRMTSGQIGHVRRAFADIKAAFDYNHSRCQNRKECLKQDLSVLQNFSIDHSEHPANPILKSLYNAIRHDAGHHVFTSQWVIFQNLSSQRQYEYRNGLRVLPVQAQSVMTSQGIQPATYNQDDVLTVLLQDTAHHHKNCQRYLNCLNRDLKLIIELRNRLAPHDPVRNKLNTLHQTIKDLAGREIFNTILYLNLYNPLKPNWYETLQRHKSRKAVGYGRKEWQAIKRSSHPKQWIPARLTTIQQTVQPTAPASPQTAEPPAQTQKSSILLKGWNRLGERLLK